jgi:hypothetical protein
MAAAANVTFEMTVEDLEFLVFAMRFMKGGVSEEEDMREYWETVFQRALDKEFPATENSNYGVTRPK